MKKIILFLMLLTQITLNAQSKNIIAQVQKYLSSINLLSNETSLQVMDVHYGDLNNDNIEDAVVYYYVTVKNGSAKIGSGYILFLNYNNNYIFTCDYQFVSNVVFKSIKNNVLNLTHYTPVKNNDLKLILSNNVLKQVK